MGFERVDTLKASSAQASDVTASSSRATDRTLRVWKIGPCKSVKKNSDDAVPKQRFFSRVPTSLRRSRGHGDAFLAARKSGPRTEPRLGLGSGSDAEAGRHTRPFSIGVSAVALVKRLEPEHWDRFLGKPDGMVPKATCAWSLPADGKSGEPSLFYPPSGRAKKR